MRELRIVTTSGNDTAVDGAAVAQLAGRMQGALLLPGDEGYGSARQVWNGMIDRYPAAVARCSGVEDVRAAVRFAREHDLLLAVRGGGHHVAGFGTCDGGLVIDLSPMQGVRVDPEARTAYAQGGARWADLDRATQAFALATPGGVVSDTGIAGLTLGGGFGWLRNKYGLSCDNLIGAEVVTADGQKVRADERENPDLLWGLRGGGGNFGIVTTFEYQLHPLDPDVMFCFVFHPGERAREALQFFRDYCAAAPEEVSALAFYGTIVPGSAGYPEEIHGRPFIAFAACYAGPVEMGERVLQPLRDFSRPLIDFSGVRPYVEVQTVLDEDYPARMLRYYWKSVNLPELSDEAIERCVAYAPQQPSPLSTVDIWHVGGAVRRVSEEASAFQGRQAGYLFNVESNWPKPDDDEANLSWTRDFVAAMEPLSESSRYFNFAGFLEGGEQAVREAFGAKYERLAALKKEYDPTNLFHLNQNIRPV